MLTARNVIVLTVSIAVVSLLAAGVSLALQTPGSGGMGADSYGTRGWGFKAICDVLEELDIPVVRSRIPHPERYASETTFVLWQPLPSLTQREPRYLLQLADWVRAGGRLVVSPAESRLEIPDFQAMEQPPRALLDDLGLPGVRVHSTLRSDDAERFSEMSERELAEASFEDVLRRRERETDAFQVEAVGAYSDWSRIVNSVRLPTRTARSIESDGPQPHGEIRVAGPDGEQVLAAAYRVGRGEIVVVSQPALLENANLPREDNSVLAVQLLVDGTSQVVFDGFYHGLTVRGNALWLWTQPTYLTITVALLVLVGLWNWREATFLGPRQESRPEPRRSIREYVEAMSRFLLNARESRKYVVKEVQDGTLWALREELGLQPGSETTHQVTAVLSRRDPERAQQLEESLNDVEHALHKRQLSQATAIRLLQRMSACLSKKTTKQSNVKSRK